MRTFVRLFDSMDRDGNGQVDISETLASGAFSQAGGGGVSSAVAKSIFRTLDRDRSETVSLRELLRVAFS